MELIAVAQKYEMNSVMTHIRGAVALQDPPFLRLETAFHIYFLAQQYGLHREAVQAARVTLGSRMTMEGLGDKLDFPGMTGIYLHELWKYHEEVRDKLKITGLGFKIGAKDLLCLQRTRETGGFLWWLDCYIDSIAKSPHLFDLTEFETAWGRHINDHARNAFSYGACICASIPSRVKRSFWEALTALVHSAMETVRRVDVSTPHHNS